MWCMDRISVVPICLCLKLSLFMRRLRYSSMRSASTSPTRRTLLCPAAQLRINTKCIWQLCGHWKRELWRKHVDRYGFRCTTIPVCREADLLIRKKSWARASSHGPEPFPVIEFSRMHEQRSTFASEDNGCGDRITGDGHRCRFPHSGSRSRSTKGEDTAQCAADDL